MEELKFGSYNQTKDDFQAISNLISTHLLEPYSVYVYWYFLNQWPLYTLTVKHDDKLIGCIISKVEPHRNVRMRGYIGMIVIDPEYRGRGIASKLVNLCMEKMIGEDKVDEICLETEVDNAMALRLYESRGFIRTKRLYRYYLNTNDAYRLLLPVSDKLGKRLDFLPPLVDKVGENNWIM